MVLEVLITLLELIRMFF
ncbi:hypothetical protein ACIU3Q_005723 [Salmonella enterica subsp. enterica serovar Kokomlemle]